MRPLRKMLLLGLLPALVFGPALPGFAQGAQSGRQRRVFTNEDVASPAPSVPAPEPAVKAAPPEPAGKAAPPAGAESAEAEPPPPKPLSELQPKERLQRLTEIQGAFQKAMEEFSARQGSENDSSRRMRWQNLTLCLNAAMQANREIISELQSQVPTQAPAPQPPAPSAPQLQ